MPAKTNKQVLELPKTKPPIVRVWMLLAALACSFLLNARDIAYAGAASTVPNKVLWAWERPEDLSQVSPEEFGVAYLACHVFTNSVDAHPHWRHQPLKVSPKMKLVPVVRIDIDEKDPPMVDSPATKRLIEVIVKSAGRPQTAMLQIDFDARLNEREYYRHLLKEVRTRLAADVPISITALASWCLYDRWMQNLPVDETIPMMFSLGPEKKEDHAVFRQSRRFHGKELLRVDGNIA